MLLSAGQFSVRAVWQAAASLEGPQRKLAPWDEPDGPFLPQRPDLAKLEDLLENEKEPGIAAPEAPPTPRIRRLLVDWGPPRSDVYVNGVLTGKTPYVGQVSCLDGDTVQIQVLPAQGAPRSKKITCHGAQILAGADEKLPSLQR